MPAHTRTAALTAVVLAAVLGVVPAAAVPGPSPALGGTTQVSAAAGAARVPVAIQTVRLPRTGFRPATVVARPLGRKALTVVRYRGSPDDSRGTRYQDRGFLASPMGAHGGVAPGEVGAFVVTGHRTSGGGPLLRIKALQKGSLVRVRYGATVFVYAVTGGYRIDASRPDADAVLTRPVPGRPGAAPTVPMITIITCATIEDNAAGDTYRDAHHNPRHRIVRYGVLVRAAPARA